MTGKTTDQLTSLASELNRIKKKLKAAQSRYDGEEPRITNDPEVWEEQITIDHMLNPKFRRRQFAEAWNEVKGQALGLLIYEFGAWGCRLIDLVGLDRFPPDIPNPPIIQRQGYFDPQTAISAVAATNDTLVAGLRVIYWCAASVRPKSLRRSKGFPTAVAQWVSDLVEFGGGYCVVYCEPLDWAMVALKHFMKVTIGGTTPIHQQSKAAPTPPESRETSSQAAVTTEEPPVRSNPQLGENDMPPDGPFPPDGFRVGGVESHIRRPKVWKLIQYLWARRNRTASFADLAGPVWGDREYGVDANNLGSLRRDANQFFALNGWAYRMKLKNEYASLVGPPS